MGERRGPNRRSIVRHGRRYLACGLLRYRARSTHPGARSDTEKPEWYAGTRAGLLPGATLALIVIFSVYVLGYPPIQPDNPQHRTPIVGVSHFTFSDFASANR